MLVSSSLDGTKIWLCEINNPKECFLHTDSFVFIHKRVRDTSINRTLIKAKRSVETTKKTPRRQTKKNSHQLCQLALHLHEILGFVPSFSLLLLINVRLCSFDCFRKNFRNENGIIVQRNLDFFEFDLSHCLISRFYINHKIFLLSTASHQYLFACTLFIPTNQN